MPQVRTICPPCRAQILLRLHLQFVHPSHRRSIVSLSRTRQKHGTTAVLPTRNLHAAVRLGHSGSKEQASAEPAPPEDEELVRETPDEDAYELARARLDPAAVAAYARERFGDHLPEGALREAEYKAYERMYGAPLRWQEDEESDIRDSEPVDEAVGLMKEGQDGKLEEVRVTEDDLEEFDEDGEEEEVLNSWADEQLQNDIAASLQPAQQSAEDLDTGSDDYRSHPFTAASRFGTFPSTLPMPKDAMTGPVSVMIADSSNRHLDEAAHRLFGGPGLPYATGTPLVSRQMRQKPIPLLASQGKMSPMEADVFMIAVWPGVYSAVTSILVELRKRLGSPWLQNLLKQPGGPRVLDAGAGGAGILAWRDVVKAEWARMHENLPESSIPPVPLGKTTVQTGSSPLRHRASVVLENTTFLPRLPDYIHVKDFSEDAQRKQFDIIIAPHTLWPLEEDYMRRQQVDNLWSLLNPNGGVLVLLEKGVPRGFEVVAGARQHMLDHLFDNDPREVVEAQTSQIPRSPASIIAPCTTHSKCPLYLTHGPSQQRKDYCHFEQRYARPAYLQRLLGATSRNHDDVPFSYVAVQRGRDPLSLGQDVNSASPGPRRLTGLKATERAFEGYDVYDEDLPPIHIGARHPASVTATANPAEDEADVLVPPEPATHPPNPFSLPRMVLPPLKRHGHVLFDVCTPAGTLERWTVPRSYGRVPYRDARKARWGDLWPLGAKQRVPRRVRLGKEPGKPITTSSAAAGEDADAVEEFVGVEGRSKIRVLRRKEDKAKGREKARLRRREERKELRLKSTGEVD